MSWRTCKKFDAHVHVLPGERTAQFLADEGPDAPWSRCGAEDCLRRMDQYGIERALLVPANDQYLYFQDPGETNRFLGGLVREHPDRFRAFADVTSSGAYFIENTPYSLEEAVELAFLSAQEDTVIVAFGSLSYLGALIKIVEKGYGPGRDLHGRYKKS